jgi:hypothetical protein
MDAAALASYLKFQSPTSSETRHTIKLGLEVIVLLNTEMNPLSDSILFESQSQNSGSKTPLLT